jgi:ribosomal protein L11 methylase PrmA
MQDLLMAQALPSSFRDPSGFLFNHNNQLFRQVNGVYREEYDYLMKSGLYEHLVRSGLLIPHEEVTLEGITSSQAYKVIKPEVIEFVSYPYEWGFSQLKDAALLTLRLQREAIQFGMSLKDASSYNVQFHRGRPIFIDTLSFERYHEEEPWVAYRQFCQHFLAPLSLAAYTDIRVVQLLRAHLDGLPLGLVSSLLPLRTYLRLSLSTHIHLHARAQKHFSDKSEGLGNHRMNRRSMLGLVDHLDMAIRAIHWRPPKTEWSDYDAASLYGSAAFQHKLQLVEEYLDKITPKPQMLWDLGANTGVFSRLASKKGILTIAFDSDASCVEQNYKESIEQRDACLLPLLLDLTNPSPGLGWKSQERMSWLERGPADAVLALALLHHLAISNNLPLERIAQYFHQICKVLIIEFVPKSDFQVQLLLSRRKDTFPDYTRENFEEAFRRYFVIDRSEAITSTDRILYRMQRKPN